MYKQAALPQEEATALGDIGAEFKRVATRVLTHTPNKEHVLVWDYCFDDGGREAIRTFQNLVERGEIIVHQMKNDTGQWCLIARSRKKPAVRHLYRGAAF